MFGLKNISINFLTDYLLWVALAFFLLIGMAVYLYRQTNPPLPLYLRILFGALRIIAIIALFLSLFEPVINYTQEFERKKKVALLLDESTSMDKIELNRSRKARRDSLLSSEYFNQFRKNIDLETYYFGGNLSLTGDKVERDKTALGEVVAQLEKKEHTQPSDYWLFISDGKSNTGRSPQKTVPGLQSPVVTVDMSAGTGMFDIGIDEVNYNPVLFVGQPSEVKAKLNWYDAKDKKVVIELLDSNRVVNQTRLNITQEEGLGEVTLKYIPTEPGQKILTVNVPLMENEEDKDNNQYSFSVKILKSRLLTLIVTDKPDYEVSFLKRLLDQSDKYEVELIVTGEKAGNLAGRFPSRQEELNRYDLVILHDPDFRKLASKQDIIKSYLSDKGGAVWVLMGEQYSFRGSSEGLNKLLPFYKTSPQKIQYMNFHGEPAEGNLFHPGIRLAENQTAIRKIWANLPPFQALVICDKVSANAVILAYASIIGAEDSKIPILGYQRIGAGKLFASAASPFWSWGFVNLGFGEDDGSYEKFVEGTASWLTVSDDLDPIRIEPDKVVYRRGEIVHFKGYAFDMGFRPIDEVTGTVKINNKLTGNSFETDLIATGRGEYQAEFFNVMPGEFTYAAKFVKDNQTLKKNEGKILVESFSLEEFDQRGAPLNLMAIARLSGGNYFTFHDFDRAVASIDPTPVEVQLNKEITVGNKFWLLIVFVICLSLEWLLRKVFQLI